MPKNRLEYLSERPDLTAWAYGQAADPGGEGNNPASAPLVGRRRLMVGHVLGKERTDAS